MHQMIRFALAVTCIIAISHPTVTSAHRYLRAQSLSVQNGLQKLVSSGPEYLDVWIVAGENNAIGVNPLDGQPPSPWAYPVPGKVLMFTWNSSSPQWIDAVNNVHLLCSGKPVVLSTRDMGPELPFARSLIAAGVSTKIGFVPLALPGSSLWRDWNPDGGALYANMIQQTKEALAAYGPQARLRGIVWVQGETDAMMSPYSTLEYARNYGATFERFIDAANRDLPTEPSNSALAVIMGIMPKTQWSKKKVTAPRLGWNSETFPNIDVVRQQQLEIKHSNLLKVDMEGLELQATLPGTQFPGLLLTKSGVCELGIRLANAYVAALNMYMELLIAINQVSK